MNKNPSTRELCAAILKNPKLNLYVDEFRAFLERAGAARLQDVHPDNLESLLADLRRLEYVVENGEDVVISAYTILVLFANNNLKRADVNRKLANAVEHVSEYYFDVCNLESVLGSGKGSPLILTKTGEMKVADLSHLKNVASWS